MHERKHYMLNPVIYSLKETFIKAPENPIKNLVFNIDKIKGLPDKFEFNSNQNHTGGEFLAILIKQIFDTKLVKNPSFETFMSDNMNEFLNSNTILIKNTLKEKVKAFYRDNKDMKEIKEFISFYKGIEACEKGAIL